MSEMEGEPIERRVLLLAPTAKDAAMTQRILNAVGISCTPCPTLDEICRQIPVGAGTVILTEEALNQEQIGALVEHLQKQPPWSDLPIVVLAGDGANSAAGRRAMELLGNVTVLERPVQMASLVSVVQTLLRARHRQYQIREHLREREQAAKERERLLAGERTARSEAERVGRVKDEFLATLSHELRTPLNAIFGWTQILRSSSLNGQELAEGLETIERNARVQAQIIEDLLDMSRIISGNIRLDVQRVELTIVIELALDTVRPAANAKQIRIQTSLGAAPAIVSGDAARLQQVFWNLLSNAIKFTPQGGRVQVLLDHVDSQLQVTITDTGEGIKPEFLPHVFDRFRQADASTTRRHGGLGLGLAIVKQLVELHGGTIRADSAGEGRGSTFVVTLPPAVPESRQRSDLQPRRPRAASARPVASEGVSLQGVKVLVVDDEPDAREMIKRLLEGAEATVLAAASAAEAMRAVQTELPDVLLSDIAMPGEDGYALIARVRALGKTQGGATPAIALTAYARAEDSMRAMSNGFQMHIAKPVEPAKLIASISSLAGRR